MIQGVAYIEQHLQRLTRFPQYSPFIETAQSLF